jgi:sugar O-acyltransferase (sialic acid O-acetyltransferase NeuD family)
MTTRQILSATPPTRLAIFGTGGHGREIAWLAEQTGIQREKIAFVVNAEHFLGSKINGHPVYTLESGTCDGWPCVVAIGDPLARMYVASLCAAHEMSPVSLIHPGVAIHETTYIGRGVVIAAGVLLTVNTSLGEHVHINIGASISHDADIGDGTTVSPGARIAGHVHIGQRVFIGIGATIINGSSSDPLVIGDDAHIAAGSCVVANVGRSMRVMGVPARPR